MTRDRGLLSCCAVVALACTPANPGTIDSASTSPTHSALPKKETPERELRTEGGTLEHARDEVRKAYMDAHRQPRDPGSLARLKRVLPKFNGRYVLEGDILIDDADLVKYLQPRPARTITQELAPLAKRQRLDDKLVVHLHDNRWGFWNWSERALTYAVDRSSFGANEEGYRRVIREMNVAADEWVAVCRTCRLTITHVRRDEEPNLVPGADLTFVVRHHPQDNGYVALGFLGRDPQPYLWIMPAWFRHDASTGVLRHEIGHILGYRHEYVDQGPLACAKEDDGWHRVTAYDSNSVMQYFCGRGTTDMRLSENDRTGHTALYSWTWLGPGGSPSSP